MKRLIFFAITAAIVALPAYSSEKLEDKVESSVEQSSSHNPILKRTTDTTEKKDVRKFKDEQGTIKAEEKVKVKRQRSDDGKKLSITTEESYKEELQD